MVRQPKSTKSINPVIRRTDRIGSLDAESDDQFLSTCFLNTGDIDILRNTNDARCIVLGRTGSGKTALLKNMSETEENVINLPPELLALTHVSNSDIIKFFENIGVHLDPFYILLWEHVITVELLKKKYRITNSREKKDIFDRLYETFINRDPSKKAALEYIEQWGDKFWERTEERVRELVEKVEVNLKGALGAHSGIISGSLDATTKLSEEERKEIRTRAQEVVNSVQLRELANLISLLAEDIFHNPQQKYFILIDGLDEDWAEDAVRYRLIKALLDTIKRFRKVQPLKIIIALRVDLLYVILKKVKSVGSQEEKYESLFLKLVWTRKQLHDMLNLRVNALFRMKYTSSSVGIDDLLPKIKVEKRDPLSYILDRTFYRPRDAILFVNECLSEADNKPHFTFGIIKSAERAYSAKRLRFLYDEWRSVFPNLSDYIKLIQRRTKSLQFQDFSEDQIQTFVLEFLTKADRSDDPLCEVANDYFSEDSSSESVLLKLLYFLYVVGVIGVKSDARTPAHWAFKDHAPLMSTEVTNMCRFQIHPCFWRSLGISPD